MLFSHAGCVLALTTTAVAVPFGGSNQAGSNDHPWWTPSKASDKSYSRVRTNAAVCNMSHAVMPTAPTPLPAPASGLVLSHVAIGRGTQNYTCETTNSTAAPVAVGAIASLFNVSCLAAQSPELLSKLPGIALDLPSPSTTDESSPAYQMMSGHHFFVDLTTPFFNLDTQLHQYGTGAFKKANSSNPPTNAVLGQNGQGNGSVAWLKLDAKTADGQVFQNVYRLNTAGGNPPKTCAGMPAAFEVEYSAEYWLYALPDTS
ncbi:hypothetical protein BAUCODRAFT_77931 [Baudoinia panamericana UAMH 10762]|uniref:Malate dehydrogenase n=1 Tax=Baudoinia panamericana (strain UAMH 10762) TaxID=717646 RepID=M2MLS1_BAUPA|nr:uncharacterized protein BAUCODRAFT_77931 [Baudoinia panamericana UAMH 10762]EMC92338.1 hypothetical protein BAUCODRAFT_77931 [Baudoinia panamericana UAMH 10762]